MQLAALLLDVCQIVLGFQRVKETLPHFNFRGPVLNLALLYLIQFFLFKHHVVHCLLNPNNELQWSATRAQRLMFFPDISTLYL